MEQAEETEVGLSAALDEKVGSLSARDIVAIINSERSWRKAWLFFKWVNANDSFQLNVVVYNVLLKVLRRGEQWKIAREVVEKMVVDGPSPDNITYSTIISFAIRCHQQEEALKWFGRMQEAGCTPDMITYSAVIDVLAKVGRTEDALELWAKMQSNGVPCDAIAFATVIKLHGTQRNFDRMMEVYEEMQSKKVVPGVGTYNSMISTLGNAGKPLQALQIFNDMLDSGLKPSPITLSLVFRTLARTRNADEALQLFEKMQEEDWTVDTIVYNALLSLCGQLGKVEEGEKIHKHLLVSKVCQPDDWTWKIVADMYVKAGRLEEGWEIVMDMVNKGRTIDLPVCMGLIQGYGRRKDFKTVLKLVDDLQAANVPFDHMLAGALLSVLVLCEEAKGEDAPAILEKIGMIHPKLKSVVEILTREDFNREEVKEEMRGMLSETAEDCRRPFCNLLMDLCWMKNLSDQAHHVLAIGVSFGVYTDLQVRSPVEWCLKLRKLSFGAARTALLGWISSLRVAFEEDSKVPPLLSIEVGVGLLYSTDNSVLVMSTFILTLLKEMQAPFEERRSGWLSANTSDVKAWLLSSEASSEEAPVEDPTVSVQT